MRAKWMVPCAALTMAAAAWGQKFEVGGAAGASFYTSKNVTRGSATGEAKPASGWAGSGYLGHNSSSYIGGELRYTYLQNDLQLKSGSTAVSFGGRSQAIHYDILVHGANREARVRPFLAAGFGVRTFQGTGKEVVAQPLAALAFLTRTSEMKPMVSFGGGVKFKVSERVQFRVDLRDYFSPFPRKVIAPAPGAKIDGWLHNFVFLAGISYLF